MALRVPFHLMRRASPAEAAAFLLFSNEVRDLLKLSAQIGAEPPPLIFKVAGGFLIIPEAAPSAPRPGTIRLRRISENCYLPCDADLVPPLQRVEAADLTRQRGLVFLPNQQCLAFDPNQPITLAALVHMPAPTRALWQPIPRAAIRPDRLSLITRVVPDITADDILQAGGDGIGEEAPSRPPRVNPLKTAGGQLLYRLGSALAALGKTLGLEALARRGQGLVDKAVSAVPRLSEALLGRQASALNELLRKFREGKIEEALRQALPMTDRPASEVSTSAELPRHDLRYSLSNVLGSGGPRAVWLGGADLHRELMDEYRKAAQAALARGDHRRAAFIYGKLLADFGSAAAILAQGGLHRDAAILYRDVLKQPRQAALEFEAAGACDEALRLFRLFGDHESAGDLLQRMGEPEQALKEYHQASHHLIARHADHLRAGELMLRKTGRADLAGAYFALGWHTRHEPRHSGNAVPCAIRLAEIYAFGQPLDEFWTLIDEVEGWLEPPANVAMTANFFNTVVRLADLPHLLTQRLTLRDRAKLALAAKLRDHPTYEEHGGYVVGELFGNSGLWAPEIVSDASFAMSAAMKGVKRPAPAARPSVSLRLGTGGVTAAVQAPESGDIIVGFASGEVMAFQPRSGRISVIAKANHHAVEALAVDPQGRFIVDARESRDSARTLQLRSYVRNELDEIIYRGENDYPLQWPSMNHLNPLILEGALLVIPGGTVEFRGPTLVPRERHLVRPDQELRPDNAFPYLILPAVRRPSPYFFQMTSSDRPILDSGASTPDWDHSERIIVEDRAVNWSGCRISLGWRPNVLNLQPEPIIGRPYSLAWLHTSVDQLEIAGLSIPGIMHWSRVTNPASANAAPAQTLAFPKIENFRCVAIWRPGHVVGITDRNTIHWLRASGNRLQEWTAATALPYTDSPAAIFPSHATEEVLVVLWDGTLVRVPMRS